MNKTFEWIKKHWIFTITSSILGIMSAIVTIDKFFKTTIWNSVWELTHGIFKSIGNWIFIQKYIVPNWLLIILWLLSITFISIFMAILFIHFHRNNSEQYTIDKYVNNVRNYRNDYIFGAIWEWYYVGDNQISSNSLKPCCPRCSCEMEVHGSAYRVHWNLFCRNCEYSSDFVYNSVDEIRIAAKLEIERKIRTGEYMDVLREIYYERLNAVSNKTTGH